MKNLFVVLITFTLLSLSKNIIAQQPTIEWGEKVNNEGGLFSSYTVVGHSNEEIFVKTYRQDRDYLTTFNLDLEETGSIELKLFHEGVTLNLLDIVQTKTGLVAILNGDIGSTWIKRYKADFKDGTFSNFQNLRTASFNYSNIKYQTHIKDGFDKGLVSSMFSSENGEYYAKVTRFLLKDTEQEVLQTVVFDPEFNELWRSKVELDVKDYVALNAQLTNKGEVYVLGEHKNPIAKVKKQKDYNYKSLTLTKIARDTFVHYSNLSIDLLNTDKIYYNNKEEKLFSFSLTRDKDYSGLFYSTSGFVCDIFDPVDGSIETISENIPLSTINGWLDTKLVKKKDGYGGLTINNFIPTEKGYLLVCEKIKKTYYSPTTIDGTAHASGTSYSSSALLIFNLDFDLSLINTSLVRKAFGTSSSKLTSYALGSYNNNFYFLYNDRRDQRSQLLKYIGLTIVNKNGEVTFDEKLSEESYAKNYGLTPRYSFQIDNKLYVFSKLMKNYKLGYFDMDQ